MSALTGEYEVNLSSEGKVVLEQIRQRQCLLAPLPSPGSGSREHTLLFTLSPYFTLPHTEGLGAREHRPGVVHCLEGA